MQQASQRLEFEAEFQLIKLERRDENIKNNLSGNRVDSSGSRYGKLADICELGNELPDLLEVQVIILRS